jgi:hypothetical protein
MSQFVLVVALVASLVAMAWLYAYKLRHPHTKADLVRARRESVDKSRSVVSGKVQEHLAPLFPDFLSQFNPKDARFLGSPLDFIVSADAVMRSRRDELSISCCACRQT